MNGLVFTDREHIDDLKWDSTIRLAPNGKIYARSSLLDLMSPGWSALVMNDYELVMPLTWRKKYGIRYLFQPPFLQQLGIFGNDSNTHAAMFINMAQNHFPFAEIYVNCSQNGDLEPRQNFILDLNKTREELAASFSPVHLKNLRRAANASLIYKASDDHNGAIDLNYALYGKKTGLNKQAYDQLKILAKQKPELVVVREVWQHQECQAAAFCLIDDKRIYFLLSAVTASGKKNQANHFLVDQLISEFSGSSMILDFEGSEMEGIADFYKGFGAVNEPYFFCKWNHLPWPYRLFKR